MNQARFKKLVSGQGDGVLAAVLRLLLNVAAVFYGLGIAVRNRLFDKGWRASYAVTPAGLVTSDRAQAAISVISVGNITVGGTGKTPMVIWLCNFLRTKDINCVILTRGYKATKGKQSDEPAVLVRNCPGAALMVNPDRLAGAVEAVRRRHAQVLIMDDGFQHRRLHRDVDIVTIDATLPFGYPAPILSNGAQMEFDGRFDNRTPSRTGQSHLKIGAGLPAGLLREPVTALKRAHATVLTRCDLVSEDNLAKLAEAISRINPNMVIARTIHAPVCAMTAGDRQIPLEQLRGRSVYAFCGIANPDAFFETINRLGVNLVGSKIYDDHHNYTARDVSGIYTDAAQSGAEMMLATEKDYNKIVLPDSASDLVMAYLAVKLQFISGQDQITQLIERSLAGKIRGKRTA